jgi:CheY-like chemotaxis protein/anti-sigma regulatory factor (Ser/Thr protein kinase)
LGEIVGVWANIHDLTSFWSIQQDLIRAKEKAEESDKLKSAFLNNISHEIRTPLNSIIGFSQIISRLIPNDPKLLKYTETIHKNGNKLIEIITDVIEISEIQSKQSVVRMDVFNLAKTIENIVTVKQSIAKEKKLSFVIHIIPNMENISIVSDENKLSKILRHLVENAIKFTNTGSIVLEIIVQNKMLEINIFDTGIGISKEIQEVILQPFRQAELGLNRSFGGSGIGLSLVKGYTELLKGNFYLESEPMKGTNIYVKIPIYWQEENTEKPNLVKTKLLIVEDDYNSSKLLQNLLVNKIDTILFATNGQEAIEVCRENKDIHLILMDLRLPVIDGYAASSIIKAFMPHIPIIALTAFDIETEKEKILKHQFDGYIFKPIQPEELFAIIKKVL